MRRRTTMLVIATTVLLALLISTESLKLNNLLPRSWWICKSIILASVGTFQNIRLFWSPTLFSKNCYVICFQNELSTLRNLQSENFSNVRLPLRLITPATSSILECEYQGNINQRELDGTRKAGGPIFAGQSTQLVAYLSILIDYYYIR